ncbi:MAG: CAAX amino terminal protease self- immunity [Methanocella sp. PtaU1.Bin125]|nr:MAG: CAAX amino terminal protease self- immunity [Methanocella sp. PtaU1.Bin125]
MPETTTTLTAYARSIIKIVVLLMVAVIVASIVDMGLLAIIWAYFMTMTGSAAQASEMLIDHLSNIWLMLALTSLQDITWVLLSVAFVIFIDRRPSPVKELGLTPGPGALKMFLAGIAVNVLFVAATVGSLLLTGWSPIVKNGLETYGVAAVAGYLAITLVIMFFVGLGEETLFRGYFQTDLTRKHGYMPALILASLAFAGLHIGFLIPGQEVSPLSIAGIFIASLVMGYLYVITGTIWASIGFHFSQDVLGAGVFLTGELPYYSAPVFLMGKSGDLNVAGISLGSVDNLVNIVMMLVVLAALYFYHRKTLKAKARY